MSPPVVAVLHIFSGVHLGARIELTSGTWLLGSADECDLILNGLDPRHATLDIQAEADKVSVTIKPEAGQVILDGAEVKEAQTLEAGTAWYLGETCFAWNLPGVKQEAIIPQLTLTAPAEPTPAEPATEESATGADPNVKTETNDTATPAEVQTNDTQTLTLEQQTTPQTMTLKRRLLRLLPLLLVAFLLCGLSFSFSTGPSRAEYPTIIKEILYKIGLPDLAVAPRWPGVEVRGAVSSATDLETLQQAVQEVSFPVYIEVAVDDDLLRAVRNALGIRGFFPLVSMERDGAEPRVKVAAFMRDTLVEADAFAVLEKDVPSPPFKTRHIVYEKDIAPLVQSALQNVGLGDVQAVYLPGQVSLTGNITPTREHLLTQLKASLSTHFGVPLFGEDRIGNNGTSRGSHLTLPSAQNSDQTKQEQATRRERDPLGGLRLTGVFIAPLSFVSTEDGRRLFKGSVLPNGNVLENINTNILTLRRGDQIFTYKLRGNQ